MAKFLDSPFGKFLNMLSFGIPRIIEGLFSYSGRNSDGSSNGPFGFLNGQNWNNQVESITGTSLGGLIGALTNRITGEHLTGAEQEANAFSAEQAQINRDFEERMANTQYQRTVADMRASGVNPALAMSNGVNVAPSGQAASSVNPQGQAFNMSDLMQMLMLPKQMKILDAQAANIGADTAKKSAETGLVEKHISAFDRITDANIKDIESRIASREVQNALNKQGISESMARQALYAQQAINAHLDEGWINKLNQAQLNYQNALTSWTNQKTKESEELVKKYAAEIDGIYNQAILQSAMAGYYSQSEENLLKQSGILDYDKEQKKFVVDHQKADRNWRIAQTTFGIVQSVGTAAAGAMVGTGALARAGMLGSSSVTASPWSFANTGGFNFITY